MRIENCKLQNGDARLRVERGRLLSRYRYVRLRWRLLAAAIDAVGWLLFGAARAVARRAIPRSQAELGNGRRELRSLRSILVIQLDHLGDAVLSLGMLRVLRRECPHAEIEVLCAPCSRELFAACPELDAVHVLDATRFSRMRLRAGRWLAALVAAGWRLRQRQFDLAIDVRGEAPHALLMFLAGSRRRLGWNCGGAGFLLTDSPRYEPGRHEVLSRLALVRALSIDAAQEDVAPVFAVTDEARATVRRLLSPWRRAAPLVVLHIGSGMPAKRWPAERWQELSARLAFERGARVALVGSQDDREIAAAVVGPHALEGVADLTGKLTVPELAALLAEADVVVGSDSAPAHLAAAVGTPVVALFSGTNQQAQWRPWGGKVQVVHSPTACWPCHRRECPLAGHPCMREIKADDVMAVVGTGTAGKMPVVRVPSAASEQRCLDEQTAPAEQTLARR